MCKRLDSGCKGAVREEMFLKQCSALHISHTFLSCEYMWSVNERQHSDDMACWLVSLNQLNVSVHDRWGWQRASYIKQLAVYIKPLKWLYDWNIQAFIMNRQYTELMHFSVFCFVMDLKNKLLYQIVLKK